MWFSKIIRGGGCLAFGVTIFMFSDLEYLRDLMKCSISFAREGFSSRSHFPHPMGLLQ